MRVILSIIGAVFLLQSCKMPKPKNEYLTYQNIVILSDMSGRLSNPNFPHKDLKEIHNIVQKFKEEDVKIGEKIGDKSCIYFSAFSDKNFIKIDLSEIKNLGEKQSYINSTENYNNNGLKEDLEKFEEKVAQKYDSIRDRIGLDLLSVLLEKIENGNIIKKDENISNGIDTTFIHYENHIYIFTDGYLEYALANPNNQFRFGLPQIRRLRNYSINNDLTIEETLITNAQLGLPSEKRKNHKNIDIHIVETLERDFNPQNSTYINRIGFRDNEILKEVWKKWIIESGFKGFEWKKY